MRITDRNNGVRGWIDALDRLDKELAPAAMHRRVDPIFAEFHESLRQSMPVRTGALKGSGQWSSTADENSYEARSVWGIGLDYAAFAIGRYRDGQHPWDDVLPAYEERFGEAINDAWDDAMGR